MTLETIQEFINKELKTELSTKELEVRSFIQKFGWRYAAMYHFVRSNIPHTSVCDLKILERFLFARTCIENFNDLEGIKMQAYKEYNHTDGSPTEYLKLIQACVDWCRFEIK
ncbi:hypothetical protein [Acinetobacter beijerinckii]|uniref:hypothetical protein n=1 Tax=Acinetobacter beijerinckii TaxID=262668 RepID=UPI00301757AB